jgi:biotin operon repressor
MAGEIRRRIKELDIPPLEKYLLLACYNWHAGWDTGGHMFASMGTLAEETGISERQVRRLIRSLEKRGLLVQESNKGGRSKVNCYRIEVKADAQSQAEARNSDCVSEFTRKGTRQNPDRVSEFPERNPDCVSVNSDCVSAKQYLTVKTRAREETVVVKGGPGGNDDDDLSDSDLTRALLTIKERAGWIFSRGQRIKLGNQLARIADMGDDPQDWIDGSLVVTAKNGGRTPAYLFEVIEDHIQKGYKPGGNGNGSGAAGHDDYETLRRRHGSDEPWTDDTRRQKYHVFSGLEKWGIEAP